MTVVPGQTAHIDAVLKVGNENDEVVVTADRPHGEAEAINRTLAAENILQVLPAEVIVSLPNANIADALGRMASVTIERDEGEGKYVQIRGTEPRLSNTMIDGVTFLRRRPASARSSSTLSLPTWWNRSKSTRRCKPIWTPTASAAR